MLMASCAAELDEKTVYEDHTVLVDYRFFPAIYDNGSHLLALDYRNYLGLSMDHVSRPFSVIPTKTHDAGGHVSDTATSFSYVGHQEGRVVMTAFVTQVDGVDHTLGIHALVEVATKIWTLEDGSSYTGTYLVGQRITRTSPHFQMHQPHTFPMSTTTTPQPAAATPHPTATVAEPTAMQAPYKKAADKEPIPKFPGTPEVVIEALQNSWNRDTLQHLFAGVFLVTLALKLPEQIFVFLAWLGSDLPPATPATAPALPVAASNPANLSAIKRFRNWVWGGMTWAGNTVKGWF